MSAALRGCAFAMLLALAACGRESAVPAPPAAPPAPGSHASGEAAGPTATTAGAQDPPGAPLAGYDREQVHFSGFGAARFGVDEAAVRRAWPGTLLPETLAGSTLCYYIEQSPRPAGGGIAFMFEGGRFVRYDVFGVVPGLSAAPGGFTVGARAADILASFGSRVQSQPHKYIEGGRYLVLSPEFGEEGRVVFEIDETGRVLQWRVGLPPQVFYVEGCS